MEEDPADVEAGWAHDLDAADEPVAGHVDEIHELDRDAEARVRHRHVGDQAVLRVPQVAVPGGVVDPGELAVDEEARAAGVAHRLVGVTDARVEQVADGVASVEAPENAAVAY